MNLPVILIYQFCKKINPTSRTLRIKFVEFQQWTSKLIWTLYLFLSTKSWHNNITLSYTIVLFFGVLLYIWLGLNRRPSYRSWRRPWRSRYVLSIVQYNINFSSQFKEKGWIQKLASKFQDISIENFKTSWSSFFFFFFKFKKLNHFFFSESFYGKYLWVL